MLYVQVLFRVLGDGDSATYVEIEKPLLTVFGGKYSMWRRVQIHSKERIKSK